MISPSPVARSTPSSSGTPSGTSPSPFRRVIVPGVVLLVAALTIAPVWLSPVLATNDGPSHLYNAALADGVRDGHTPFATYFQLEGGVRPNVTTEWLLATLGPWLGWDTAERVVVTLIMTATFGLGVALVGRGAGRAPDAALLVPLAGWLATSWFIWVGAYDFSLSLPLFCGVLLLLDRPLTPPRQVLLQVLLGLLYLTHVFTFAIAIALVAGTLGWQAMVGAGSWRQLWVPLPALALLLIEMTSGGQGTGAVFWGDLWSGLRDLATGDFVVSTSALDLAAGIPIMAAVGIVSVVRWRAARRLGRSALAGTEVVGLALVVLSLVAPQGVGPGTLIPIRMRCLGVLALLPAIAQVAVFRPAYLAAGAATLLAALGAHTGALIRQGGLWGRQLELIDQLLTAAGARQGSWVATRLTVYRTDRFNVVGYLHAVDRVALRRGLIILDNYEALYGVFSTTWRGVPDWAEFRQATGGLTARLDPGTIHWPDDALFVLHESDRTILVADPRLAVVRTASGGPFAVTLLRKVE